MSLQYLNCIDGNLDSARKGRNVALRFVRLVWKRPKRSTTVKKSPLTMRWIMATCADLSKGLPWTVRGRNLINRDGFDKTAQIPMEWETDISELLGSPRHDLVDKAFGRGLVVGEPLVVGWAESVSVAQFTGNTKLADMDHARVHQGVPDHGEPASGHELRQVIVFQVNEAVAPSQMDPAHVDPVKQVSGIVSKVPQFLGQMNVGVEGVRYVEDDPLAGFLGCAYVISAQFEMAWWTSCPEKTANPWRHWRIMS